MKKCKRKEEEVKAIKRVYCLSFLSVYYRFGKREKSVDEEKGREEGDMKRKKEMKQKEWKEEKMK